MKRIAAVLAMLVLLGVQFSGCAAEKTQAPGLLEPVGVKIDTAKAYTGTIYNEATYEGVVLPKIDELSFTSDGLIGELDAYIGLEVKRGDILARLDISLYQKQLESLQSTLDYTIKNNSLTQIQDQCDIEIAKTELEELKSQDASDAKLANKEIEIESLQNTYDANVKLGDLSLQDMNKKISDLKTKISNSLIISPCDGTVVFTIASEGNRAAAYNAVIWVAEDSDTYISSDYVSSEDIKKASQVYATVAGDRVEVEYKPYEKSEYLSIVAAGKDPKSKFNITDSKGITIKSGMYALVYVISNYTENALIVPAGAVKKDTNGEFFVYKYENGEKIRQVVKRGVVTDALVQITDGLVEGDEVCVGN